MTIRISSGAWASWGLSLVTALALSACSSSPDKPQPAPLGPVAALIGTQQVWSTQMGPGSELLVPMAVAGQLFLANSAGTLSALDASTGREAWRVQLGTELATGAGSDGETAAVVTRSNELVAVANGKEIWRVTLPARAFTAPFVAGRRVFVLTADRTVTAFDGRSGARLWSQSRTAEPLVLRESGTLLAVGDTLVAGISGRLTGFNPLNGSVRWEAPIATPRGTNEIERLVDIVGQVSRVGSSVCVRAYSAAVGCVDAAAGNVLWRQPAQGSTGLHGDDKLVFGVEADGKLQAWKRDNGDLAWSLDRLQYRQLSAPLAVGRVVVLGDSAGLVHLLSREDGSEMGRLATDGSAVVGAPILVGETLVVQTRNGGVYAWRPQ